ncbi:hypothetical protein AVEN_131735-1 [Araneus ventricosus]|uniref:Uncharacterized protein n=1 Tax=Araneus ventricosus TaxID=182803 RepID=A0A4Y2P586_ARAVE|nr:hypothetical protein AVEN_131735-1 [Araneus ventricosus]
MQRYINPSPGIIVFPFTNFINKSSPLSSTPTRLIAIKTKAIWASSAIPLPKMRSHCNLKTDSHQYLIADYPVPFQRGMDRLPAVSDTKVSS